jgi:hypothetical protein
MIINSESVQQLTQKLKVKAALAVKRHTAHNLGNWKDGSITIAVFILACSRMEASPLLYSYSYVL